MKLFYSAQEFLNRQTHDTEQTQRLNRKANPFENFALFVVFAVNLFDSPGLEWK